MPVVIGALGAIPRYLVKHLTTLGLDNLSPSQLQQATLVGTAPVKIPLRVLGPRRKLGEDLNYGRPKTHWSKTFDRHENEKK